MFILKRVTDTDRLLPILQAGVWMLPHVPTLLSPQKSPWDPAGHNLKTDIKPLRPFYWSKLFIIIDYNDPVDFLLLFWYSIIISVL